MLGSFPLVLCAFILLMRLHERRTVAAFQTAGALSPDQGRSADDLGLRTTSIGWRRLRSHAVVRETAPESGLYYLDAEVWQAVRGTRRRVLLALLMVFVATVVLYRTSWGR